MEKAKVSRRFVVEQATLNAIERLKPVYSREWCKDWDKAWLPQPFFSQVIYQYRLLLDKYEIV